MASLGRWRWIGLRYVLTSSFQGPQGCKATAAFSQYTSAADGKVTQSHQHGLSRYRLRPTRRSRSGPDLHSYVAADLHESGLNRRIISLLERGLDESQAFMQQRLEAAHAMRREEKLVACHDAQIVKSTIMPCAPPICAKLYYPPP
jgi:hypothetical protein